MVSPGVCQVPEGSGEQRKMEETGCEIICSGLTTLAVNGQRIRMMLMTMMVIVAVELSVKWLSGFPQSHEHKP